MTSTSRTRVVAALSVTTASALAAAVIAAPATASGPTVAGPAAARPAVARTAQPGVRTVTLLTGDRVVLRTDAAGHRSASVLPGSPHYGRPIEYVATGAHTWVVPKLPHAVRARLDPSVFDVGALAGGPRRVPLTVTFARGTAAHALPGLDVRTASASRSASGRTTATASYDARRPLPARLASALSGVTRIAVRTAAPVAPTYELHTLTIDGTNAKGKPLPGADVFVMNTDDGRLFGAFGGIVHGQWKVSVPTGNYLILSDDFRHVVVHTVSVTGDTETSLSMADATVKPQVTLPGHSSLGPSLDVIASDAPGHSFVDFGFSGLLPKISPVASFPQGTLFTEIAGLWSAKGYQPYSFDGNTATTHPIKQVAATREVLKNVPKHLTFHYHPGDFARVAVQHHATGPKVDALDGWAGVSPLDFFVLTELFPSARPGVIHAMFQGSKHVSWDSMTTVSTSFRSFSQLDQTASYHRGQHATVPFFRAPVTPVADRGSESAGTGPACALCVKSGVLHGLLSMLTSGGTTQLGIDDHGSWKLLRGHTTVQRGTGLIAPFVKGVTPGQQLRLEATTVPPNPHYQLSSQVTDSWSFALPSGDAPVPLLRADYVPPTDLQGHGRRGTESFPITFDNLGPVDARITQATVRWSANGTTWHRAHVVRRDANTFRVSYAEPAATNAHRYLSLRVAARDQAGRTVSEQVDHAYLLPASGPRPTHTAHHAPSHRFRPGKLCRTSVRSQYGCYVELSKATRTLGRASGDPAGWGAPALRDAYDLSGKSASTTVAVIVAYDYPSAEADMNHYRRQFGLPACTSASGCFTKLNQRGTEGPYPPQDEGWGVEASLDLQMISAACPTCHIVLVEANQPTDGALGKAEAAAVAAGATVTNHSFGRIELTGTDTEAGLYDHPGVTAVASTGDFGYGPASFPASSPSVVAVGGTTLSRSSTDPRGWTEKAWQFGGSGCSAYFDKVGGQTDSACHGRTEGDLSAVAQDLAIYNTSLPRKFRGWLRVDGTSASSPLVAGIIGASGSAGLRPSDLYAEPRAFNDVVGGANGFCRGSYMCTAVPGYDAPTGLGSPEGSIPFPPV